MPHTKQKLIQAIYFCNGGSTPEGGTTDPPVDDASATTPAPPSLTSSSRSTRRTSLSVAKGRPCAILTAIGSSFLATTRAASYGRPAERSPSRPARSSSGCRSAQSRPHGRQPKLSTRPALRRFSEDHPLGDWMAECQGHRSKFIAPMTATDQAHDTGTGSD